MRRWRGGAVLAVLSLACYGRIEFRCDDDEQCDAKDRGRCEEVGYCSYPEEVGACDGSGRRYGENAGDGLYGRCVPADVAEDSTGAGSSSSSSSGQPEGSEDDPSTSSTTSGDDASGTSLEGSTVGLTDPGLDSTGTGVGVDSGSDDTVGCEVMVLEPVVAEVAFCAGETGLSAAQCEVEAGAGLVVINLARTVDPVTERRLAYFRFQLPEDIGGTLVAARLRLRAGDTGAEASGEIRVTAPFELVEPLGSLPTCGVLLGPDLGMVDPNADAVWSLDLVRLPAGTIHVCLEPSVEAEARYVVDPAGETPPQIELEICP